MEGLNGQPCILGGGMTGLAAGMTSGFPVFEAAPVPGGICSSYYMRPDATERSSRPPADGEAYRFELGGGHWIFGGDPEVLRLIESIAPLRSYHRKSSVFLTKKNIRAPFPLQYHLAYLGPDVARRVADELSGTPSMDAVETLEQWLQTHFGPTLNDHFFGPFHERYTAGLWKTIAPQDAYKSPIDREKARQSVYQTTEAAGYNVQFVYPVDGLDALSHALAAQAHVHYGKRVVAMDPEEKVVAFEDGTEYQYANLLSTLPLNQMASLTSLKVEPPPDPHTSVLVLNIGAVKGIHCPDDHWMYLPDSKAGFFRIGFYSNVEEDFLPASRRGRGDRVSLYVERAFAGGERPVPSALESYIQAVIAEIQAYGFIEKVEVVDPTWIEVAYTWSWPGSTWREEMLALLEAHDIHMVGRYGRWRFQGIADSIRDGLRAGALLGKQSG